MSYPLSVQIDGTQTSNMAMLTTSENQACERLSPHESILGMVICVFLKEMPYYEFSAHTNPYVRNMSLNEDDFYGMKSAWGICALLLGTNKKLFDLFVTKRIATHYSDERDSWLFVHQPETLMVYRSSVVEQSGTDIEGETGEVARKCRELRSRLYNLSNLYNVETPREFQLNLFCEGGSRKRKLRRICTTSLEELVNDTPDVYFTTPERTSLQINVQPPVLVCTIRMEVEEARATQALCQRYVDTIRDRERLGTALDELQSLFPTCVDACLGGKGVGARIKECIKSTPGLDILLGVVEATDVETIREWVHAMFVDVEDGLKNLMNKSN